ncbi:YsnF/AvaK domain-containing protein [Salinicoccus sp. Marseille-QA3877]
MRKIETFVTEEELLRRIEQLKAEGVEENAMTVVADKDLAGDALNYTEVNFKAAEGSAWDKIASWFTEDEPEDRVMSDLELSAEEEAEYKSALDRGEFLLYINNRTADADTYAGNDGSVEKDGPGAGAVQGERDQFVPDSDRENALGEREGAYGIDEKVTDDNYGLTEDEWNDLSEEERIQLREERLKVDKENVRTGEVNVDKHVETDHQEFDVPVEREEVTIEKRPVEGERKAGGLDDDLTDDDSIHIPVSEERVNVDKESVVDEEVVVRKDKVQDTEHVSEDVRREEVDIDETDNGRREERNRKSGRDPDYPGQDRDRI